MYKYLIGLTSYDSICITVTREYLLARIDKSIVSKYENLADKDGIVTVINADYIVTVALIG